VTAGLHHIWTDIQEQGYKLHNICSLFQEATADDDAEFEEEEELVEEAQ
jgi:hypothetical protein